jgi:hypothetical protein
LGEAVEDTDPVSFSTEVDVESLRTNEDVVLPAVDEADIWSETRFVGPVDEISALDEDGPASSVEKSAK